ncbi:glycosyltransferase family 39 protein [Dokdonella sp.]|uniref:glycosyltransferase family 39 protein n=1 Tax=Dokdonella sp. TaxID=2291710 RepID=UPI003526CA27
MQKSGKPWLRLAIGTWLLLNIVLLWLYYSPARKPLVGDEFDYHARALALLAGQPVIEQFIWPPGQTWFLAAIGWISGSTVLAAQLVQTGLLVVCAGLLIRLWRTVDNPLAAFLAASIFLLNPGNLAYAHWLWPEVTHLACLLGALALLLTVSQRPRLCAFLAGLLIGLALLFKSLMAGLWPVFFLFFLKRREGRLTFSVASAGVFAAGLLLAALPALWKGQLETGRPMIADSSMYNLEIGIRDRSRSDYIDEAGLPALTAYLDSAARPQDRNAIAFDRIRKMVAERGLPDIIGEQLGTQYFRLFNAKTLLVSQMPGPACAGRLGAYAENPLGPALVGLSQAAHTITLLLCAFGVALWRRWRQPLIAFVAVYLVYQLALYFGLHVMQRYLFQMMPLLCGFAGSFLALLVQRDTVQSALAVSRWRISIGAALALTLLGLAWLGPVLDGNCS